jgi:hypothetical protein
MTDLSPLRLVQQVMDACYYQSAHERLFELVVHAIRSIVPPSLPLSTSADPYCIMIVSICQHTRNQRTSQSSKCTENLTEKRDRIRGKTPHHDEACSSSIQK